MDRRNFHRPSRYVVAVALGILIYIVSQNAIIGAIVPSLAALGTLLRAGVWQLKRDPWRARGRICLVFYIAAAFWSGAAAALVSVVIFVLIAALGGGPPAMDEFTAVLFTLLVGVLLNSFVGLVGVLLALCQSIPVWVHPTYQFRDQRVAPLQHVNYAIFVVATSILFPVVATGCGILTLLTLHVARNDVGGASALLGFLLVFGGPLAMIPVYAWISSRIIARDPPDECLPADLGPFAA